MLVGGTGTGKTHIR
ncbi:hypothetical protein [Lacimonas salitolerans]|uniref:Uncharacterized protein n=1 Tax=Lacimonas salitolerans TaxID=1323750 RepID=A0ABW4EJT1_9RHOB